MTSSTQDHDHSSEQDHDHAHTPKVTSDNERRILISFLIIFSFMLVEAVGGYVSGSLALLADAGHMLTDAVALGLAFVAFRLGRRLADKKRTFGYARFEVIAGLMNAMTLFGIVGFILWEAIDRFRDPQPVLAGPMFVIAFIGMLVNLFVLWLLTRGDNDHVNVKGAILHVMGDLLGSVGAIVAAVVILTTGWTPVDPILSVLVSCLVLRSAWRLLKESLNELLEGAPRSLDVAALQRDIRRSIPEVRDVHHVHVWLVGEKPVMTLHVQVVPPHDHDALLNRILHFLEHKYEIEHATVQMEYQPCSGPECHLNTMHAGHDHHHHH